MKNRAWVIKLALFATGLSGIVAEYILATLASYFIGDSIVQWTLIISLMLFFMGLGSRLSQFIKDKEFEWFIATEFVLSLVVSFSAVATYALTGFYKHVGIFIYFIAIFTGLLIGLEIPLAMRLNERFEELKINVSSILEKDYYGSLLGGIFFAFVGLPYLGLSYTPFILGIINLLAAIALINAFPTFLEKAKRFRYNIIAGVLMAVISFGFVSAEKIVLFGEQRRYQDKIIYSDNSRYQKIVITEWKDDHWLYLNNNLQLCSYDEPMYHEVLVHPAMSLNKTPYDILILGGGDGCAVRELLKYEEVQSIKLVDLDPAVTDLAKTHPVLTELNKNSLFDPKVEVINQDGFIFLDGNKNFYDLIIIDLPDPRSVELSRLYSYEFYELCRKQLRPNGVLITQAGSPYYATRSYNCIEKTMEAAGFSVLPLHNQIITMGEWGWILGTKEQQPKEQIIQKLKTADFSRVETRWYNRESVDLITSFGKNFFAEKADSVKINKIHEPIIHRYYLKGSWDLY